MLNTLDSTKRALPSWIWEELGDIEFSSIYDAFSGQGKVATFFKRKGYQTFASDILQCHYWQSKATVENNLDILTPAHFEQIVQDSSQGASLFEVWADHYFTQDETEALGRWWSNLNQADIFQQNSNLKAVGYSAVYHVMAYWLSLNQNFLQPKKHTPDQLLEHYIRWINDHQITDNQMPNMAYCMDAYDLVPELGAEVIWIYPPGLNGLRHTNRKTELAECWTRRITQINLEGAIESASHPKLGQPFTDADAYLKAFKVFLDKAQGNRIWVVVHNDRMGISLESFEEALAQKRSIWKKASFEVPYPTATGHLSEVESIFIAVSE